MGLINLLTPISRAAPLTSIVTDDLGILHDEDCGCGISSPYLEIVGRVGLEDIKTCAAGAEDLLKGAKSWLFRIPSASIKAKRGKDKRPTQRKT